MIAVVMVTYIYRAAANVGNVDNRHVTQVIGFFLYYLIVLLLPLAY